MPGCEELNPSLAVAESSAFGDARRSDGVVKWAHAALVRGTIGVTRPVWTIGRTSPGNAHAIQILRRLIHDLPGSMRRPHESAHIGALSPVSDSATAYRCRGPDPTRLASVDDQSPLDVLYVARASHGTLGGVSSSPAPPFCR